MSKPNLAQLLNEAVKRAETSKEYPHCPNCGHVLEGWRPSEITSDSDSNDDSDNGDDDDDGRELDAKAKSRVVQQLLARKRRR
jgi:hypothetical protein